VDGSKQSDQWGHSYCGGPRRCAYTRDRRGSLRAKRDVFGRCEYWRRDIRRRLPWIRHGRVIRSNDFGALTVRANYSAVTFTAIQSSGVLLGRGRNASSDVHLYTEQYARVIIVHGSEIRSRYWRRMIFPLLIFPIFTLYRQLRSLTVRFEFHACTSPALRVGRTVLLRSRSVRYPKTANLCVRPARYPARSFSAFGVRETCLAF